MSTWFTKGFLSGKTIGGQCFWRNSWNHHETDNQIFADFNCQYQQIINAPYTEKNATLDVICLAEYQSPKKQWAELWRVLLQAINCTLCKHVTNPFSTQCGTYADVTWALWGLKLPVALLFIRQLIQVTTSVKDHCGWFGYRLNIGRPIVVP